MSSGTDPDALAGAARDCCRTWPPLETRRPLSANADFRTATSAPLCWTGVCCGPGLLLELRPVTGPIPGSVQPMDWLRMKIGVQVRSQGVSEMPGFRFAQMIASNHKKGLTGRWSQERPCRKGAGCPQSRPHGRAGSCWQ